MLEIKINGDNHENDWRLIRFYIIKEGISKYKEKSIEIT